MFKHLKSMIAVALPLLATAAYSQPTAGKAVRPQVEVGSTGLTFSVPGGLTEAALYVIIVAPDDTVVFDESTQSGLLSWHPLAGAVEGAYRYEARIVSPSARARPSDESGREPSQAGAPARRRSGMFKLQGGRLTDLGGRAPSSTVSAGESGSGSDTASQDPSALANLTASGSSPTVFFDDTDTAGTLDGHIVVQNNPSSGSPFLSIGAGFGTWAWLEKPTASSSPETSLRIDQNYDVHLGSDSVFIDRSSDLVGIGTTAPTNPLTVVDDFGFQINIGENGTTDGHHLDSFNGQFGIGPADGTIGLQFRIFDAPANALVLSGSGVGVGAESTDATLHVVEDDSGLHNRVLARLTGSNFAPQFEYQNGSTGDIWREGMNSAGHFVINQTDDLGVAEMRITPAGQVFVNGTQVHPDYVFQEDYELMPLSELKRFVRDKKHLPGVVSSEKAQGKVDLSSFPLQLLEKVEELTLYTIQQEERLSRKDAEIAALRNELQTRLAALETRLAEASP